MTAAVCESKIKLIDRFLPCIHVVKKEFWSLFPAPAQPLASWWQFDAFLTDFLSHTSVLLQSFSSYPSCHLYLSGWSVGRPTNMEKTSNSVGLFTFVDFFNLLLGFVTWQEPFDTYLVHLGVSFSRPNHRFEESLSICLDNAVLFDKVITFRSEGVGNFYRRSSLNNQYHIL